MGSGGGRAKLLAWVPALLALANCAAASTVYSSRLVHRFSDELRWYSGAAGGDSWPVRGSLEYYQRLLVRDIHRKKMRLGSRHQLVFPSEGSQSISFGNELGWLHYTWIDVGTPSTSFLVALDDGSDLFWLPCNCIQCAPLSANYYTSLVVCSLVYGASILQDTDLSEYDPAKSSTSKSVPCDHDLCDSSPKCKSSTSPCPYDVEYLSGDTSSSGVLFEDILHLSSSSASTSNNSLQASIVLGCGSKQTGGYLDGAAPDGLMGLGLDEKSVPSMLAKAGLVNDSFSLCFNDDGSGTVFFGDQGVSSQKMTPFVPLNGTIKTYIVDAEAACIGKTCLEQTSFKILIDSGTSFTFLPAEIYHKVVQEFDRQVNATRLTDDKLDWEFCYKSSAEEQSGFPSIKLIFAPNNSFVIHSPMFPVFSAAQEMIGHCLSVTKTDIDIGIMGQDFMEGYHIVFDRESMKLGWSPSNCSDLSKQLAPTPSKPLPSSDGQQGTPGGHAVAPAVAGKTPSKSSASLSCLVLFRPFAMLIVPFLHHWVCGHGIP